MPKGFHLQKVLIVCKTCGVEFQSVGSDTDRKYCSIQCKRAQPPKWPRDANCAFCGNHFKQDRKRTLCCSKTCAGLLKKKKKFDAGIYCNSKSAKKELLTRTNGCNRCGWNNLLSVLEIHHIDRNRSNNHISNLEILCPNCHTIEHYLAKDGNFKANLGARKPKATLPSWPS